MYKFINELPDEVLKKRTRFKETDIRGDYYRDQTAIIHSLPFRRLKRKTQVFFAPANDHICTRIEHVLHVTSVATTICKGLGLDIEMAQAIALGHDIGHPPFGHVGESILTEILKKTGKNFIHEINSYRLVEYIANKGEGLNLCYAVKDGIVSHCGEKFEQYIKPDFNVKNLDDINNLSIIPATYEGCVVRLSDKISYLGRDIEDAMRLNIINKSNISKEVLDILKVDFDDLQDSVNSLIIDRLINDAIDYSNSTGMIGISDECHKMMKIIKDFNYRVIYGSKILNDYSHYVSKVINIIFNELYDIFQKFEYDFDKYRGQSIEPYKDFANYLESYKDYYLRNGDDINSIITDYISGMTDDYALNFCKKVILPKKIF
jgi:dGTPase